MGRDGCVGGRSSDLCAVCRPRLRLGLHFALIPCCYAPAVLSSLDDRMKKICSPF
jgi:hypothetical protein